MSTYYVNTKAQVNGDHEVHVSSCTYLPSSDSRIYLGDFASCSSAVAKARDHFRQVNGCYFCSRACHSQ
jgi:hypothetical protein